MKGISIRGFIASIICTLLSLPALANPNFVGYFEGKPDKGGARNRICIKQLHDSRLEIQISTAYCPSEECMNARFDGILFKAKLDTNSVSYTNQSGCNLKIKFIKGGARVTHNPECRDSDHTYFYAVGSYKFVKGEGSEDDCGM